MVAADLPERAGGRGRGARRSRQRIVLNATGPATLRFLPPLVIGEADVDRCSSSSEQAL